MNNLNPQAGMSQEPILKTHDDLVRENVALRIQHAEDVALLREVSDMFELPMDYDEWTVVANKLKARLEKA